MNKFYLAIVFSVILVSTTNAQNVLADGNKYFAQGNYFEAATCYEKVLGINKPTLDKVQGYLPYGHKKIQGKGTAADPKAVYNRDSVVYKLAESYRMYNNFENAEKYYKKSIDSSKLNFPLRKYWYAICLRSNKKYKESEAAFNQFLGSYGMDDKYNKSAVKELEILKNIGKLTSKKDSALYTIRLLDPSSINVEGATTSPAFMSKGGFLFTSSRLDSTDLKGLGTKHPKVVNHIYTATASGAKISSPVRLAFANDTFLMNKGAATVTPDGKKMYFTIWEQVNGKKVYSICVADNKNNVWGEPKKLGKSINVKGYSAKQPFVTTDGKYLLFASDRPGGYGGFDLWYAQLGRDAYVLDAFNLGESVNTFADDQAPFYHNSTQQLVFSSNGRIGMGGFDLYRAKGTITGGFTSPTNLGYPTNSSKDELDFVSVEGSPLFDNAFYSSDKGDVCCPQIYNLHKEVVAKSFTGVVLDSLTGGPVADASIAVSDSVSGKVLYAFKTNAAGSYVFKTKELPSLSINASKDGFTTDQANYTGVKHLEELDAEEFTLPTLQIKFKRRPPPDIIVYFDYDADSLTATARLQLDSMVERLKADSTMRLEIEGNTDGKGKYDYNVRLGRRRSESCLNYFVKAGIPDKNLFIVTFGMEHPVDKNTLDNGDDNPEGRKRNRRVEFRILKQSTVY